MTDLVPYNDMDLIWYPDTMKPPQRPGGYPLKMKTQFGEDVEKFQSSCNGEEHVEEHGE